MQDRTRKKLLTILSELYPDPESELDFTSDYELVVAVILSAQCTDKKVNEVSPALFREYPGFEALAGAEQSRVEQILRPINYYRTKAKNIIAMAQTIARQFGGELPSTHAELLTLPGVGNKTANVIIAEKGFGEALAVDTHVHRVAHRLGLSSGKNARQTEEDLTRQFESRDWRTLHHSLILHGRRVCKALRPVCEECRLNKICPSAFLAAGSQSARAKSDRN